MLSYIDFIFIFFMDISLYVFVAIRHNPPLQRDGIHIIKAISKCVQTGLSMESIQDLGINSYMYGHLIFDKGARNTHQKKRQHLQQTGWLYIEECKYIHNNHSAKTQLQMDQRPQHQTRYSEPDRKESGEWP